MAARPQSQTCTRAQRTTRGCACKRARSASVGVACSEHATPRLGAPGSAAPRRVARAQCGFSRLLEGPNVVFGAARSRRAALVVYYAANAPSHRFAFPTLSRLRPGLLQVQCRILLAERSLCFRGAAAAARSRQAAAAPRTCRAVRASQLAPRAFQWPRRQLPPSTTTPCLGACCWSLLRVSVSEGTSERRSSAY